MHKIKRTYTSIIIFLKNQINGVPKKINKYISRIKKSSLLEERNVHDILKAFSIVSFIGILCGINGLSRYSIGGDDAIYSGLYKLIEFVPSLSKYIYYNKDSSIYKKLLFIDVAYDQQLIRKDREGIEGDSIGNINITDRKKLLDFLTIAKSLNNYDLIMLDINFTKESWRSCDFALGNLIKSMRNIYIPKHRDTRLPLEFEGEKTKAYFSDFGSTLINSEFSKYEFIQKKQKSMPLAMTGYQVENSLLFPHINKKLSYNDIMIPMYINNASLNRYSNELNWHNYLGADILSCPKSIISELINKKIVIIGNLSEDVSNDMHETYVDNLPGAIINTNAYIALKKGLNIISWQIVLLWFCVYFAYALFLVKQTKREVLFNYISNCTIQNCKHIIDFINKCLKPLNKKTNIKSIKFHQPSISIPVNFKICISFICYMIPFSLITTLIAIILYIAQGRMSDLFIPNFFFAVVIISFQFNKFKHEKNS